MHLHAVTQQFFDEVHAFLRSSRFTWQASYCRVVPTTATRLNNTSHDIKHSISCSEGYWKTFLWKRNCTIIPTNAVKGAVLHRSMLLLAVFCEAMPVANNRVETWGKDSSIRWFDPFSHVCERLMLSLSARWSHDCSYRNTWNLAEDSSKSVIFWLRAAESPNIFSK